MRGFLFIISVNYGQKSFMPKNNTLKIIISPQNRDFLAKRMKLEMQNPDSLTAKIMREMQNSPAMKVLREIENSPAMKVFRDMEQSPAMKALQAMENSSITQVIGEMQSLLKEKEASNHYIEIVEERISMHDEIREFNQNDKKLDEQSLFINTILISIYILVLNAQVPLDQFFVNLAQNLLNSTLFFFLQSKYEISKNLPNSFNKKDFKNSRITTKTIPLYFNPHLKSDLIENLEQYKFLETIFEPDLHKSWLKVRTEIRGEILEGYVLRRYTSPIK